MTDAPERGPKNIWLTIDRRGKVSDNPDAHVKPCLSVEGSFTKYTRTAALCVEVKPLVWRSVAGGWGTEGYYIMPVLLTDEYRAYGIKGDHDGSAQYPTLEAAKAAAQAHHDAQIAAAINTRTVAEVRAEERAKCAEEVLAHRYGDYGLDTCNLRKRHREDIADAIRALV